MGLVIDMKNKKRLFVMIACLFFSLSFFTFTSAQNIMTVDNDGITEYLNKPQAIYSNENTFFCFTNSDGEVLVRSFNHTQKIFSDETILSNQYDDDHHAPTLLMDNSGYIYVFYIDAAASHFGDVILRKSSNSYDIGSFDSEITVATGSCTYPKPFFNSSGGLTVIFRNNTGGTSIDIARSDNNGVSWSVSTLISDVKYSQQYQEVDFGDYVHLTSVKQIVTGNGRNNTYYCYTDDGGATWKDNTGTVLSIPFSYTDMTMVWDGTNIRQLDIVSDTDHNVHVLMGDNINRANETIPIVHLWRDSGTWYNESIENVYMDCFHTDYAGENNSYPSGGCFDPVNPNYVYLGVRESANVTDLKRYVKSGDTWSLDKSITNFNGTIIRPMSVRNGHDDMYVTFSEGYYNTELDFDTKFYVIKKDGIDYWDLIIKTENVTYTFDDYNNNLNLVEANLNTVKFNNTNFSVTPTNYLNIELSYLDDNILGASAGDTVLSFSADSSGGLVYFNLSGFDPNKEYTIKRDNNIISTVNTDGTGLLSFTNDVWSDHDFDILFGSLSVDDDSSYEELSNIPKITTSFLWILIFLTVFGGLLMFVIKTF